MNTCCIGDERHTRARVIPPLSPEAERTREVAAVSRVVAPVERSALVRFGEVVVLIVKKLFVVGEDDAFVGHHSISWSAFRRALLATLLVLDLLHVN